MRRAGCLLAAAAFWSGGAAGHAGLAASVPADGAALATPPAAIELRFTEPVTAMAVKLIGARGAPMSLPAPPVASEVMTLAVPGTLERGVYTVSFRVISADSHPIGGSIVFAIGEPALRERAAHSLGEVSAPGHMTLLRALRDLALMIAVGGALFLLAIARFPAERAVLGGAGLVAAIGSVALIGLQGAEMLGERLWSREAWRVGLASSFGLSASVAALATLSIAIAGTLAASRVRLAVLGVGALAAIASLPLTGHAMTARPGAVAFAALAAHGLTAAFWIGSLAALLAILSAPERGAVLALRRFSRWAMLAVAILVGAGVIFALLQLGSVADLVASAYGRLVSAKALILAALLALAALNRYRWLPMLEQGVRGAAARLRWSIGAEVALAVCVIGVTAILVQTSPPRAAAAAPGFVQKMAYKDDFAELSVEPARAGPNAIVLRFVDKQGLPFDPEEVLVEVGNPAAGVEPASRPLRRVAPGHYRREGSELAFPGRWTIEVQARLEAAEIATFRSEVSIR